MKYLLLISTIIFVFAGSMVEAGQSFMANEPVVLENEMPEDSAINSHQAEIYKLNRERIIIQEYVRRWKSERLQAVQAEIIFEMVEHAYQQAMPLIPYEKAPTK